MSSVELKHSFSPQEIQNRALSRRRFVHGTAMTAATAIILTGLNEAGKSLPPNIPAISIDEYTRGNEFLTATDEYWKILSEPMKTTGIPTNTHWLKDTPRLAEITYSYDGNEPLTLIITHKPGKEIKRKVLIALDGTYKFFTPLMQSSVRPTDNETGIIKNTGKITLVNPLSSPATDRSQIEDIRLIAQSGNDLQNLIAGTTPLYAIRKNNLKDLTRDMPWFSWNTFLKSGGVLTEAQSICLNSEIGGYSWKKRRRLYDRLTDMQLAYQAKIHNVLSKPYIDSQIIEEGTLLGGGHSWVKFAGLKHDRHLLIQILTDNNTFGSNLQTPLFFYQRPILLPPGIPQHKLLTRNPEILIASLQQLIEMGNIPEKDIKELHDEYYGYLETARHFKYMTV